MLDCITKNVCKLMVKICVDFGDGGATRVGNGGKILASCAILRWRKGKGSSGGICMADGGT